ncbi:MAG: porin family protein [Agarilytica sp.]
MKNIVLGVFIAATAMPALSDSYFSVDALLGSANQKSNIDGGREISGSDLSIGVRGAFNVNENFALEASHFIYGEATESYVDSFGDDIDESVETMALRLGVKGSIPLGDVVSLNGRAGLSMWDYEYEYRDSFFDGLVFKADDNGVDLYYGMGIQFNLNEKFTLAAEYDITEMGVKIEGVSIDHEVKNLALSVGYIF